MTAFTVPVRNVFGIVMLLAHRVVDVGAIIFRFQVDVRLGGDDDMYEGSTTRLLVSVPLKELERDPQSGRLRYERLEAKVLLNKIHGLYTQELNKEQEEETLPPIPDVSHLALIGGVGMSEFEPDDDVSTFLATMSQYGARFGGLSVIDKRNQKPEGIHKAPEEEESTSPQKVIAGGIETKDLFVVIQGGNDEKIVCFKPQSGLLTFLRSRLIRNDERLFQQKQQEQHQGRERKKKDAAIDGFSVHMRLSELENHAHKIIKYVDDNTCDSDEEDDHQNETNKDSDSKPRNSRLPRGVYDPFSALYEDDSEFYDEEYEYERILMEQGQGQDGPSWDQLEKDVQTSLVSLARFLRIELEAKMQKWQDVFASNHASFESLAAILGEGSEVVTDSADGYLQGGKVTVLEFLRGDHGRPNAWKITVQTVLSNGIQFGTTASTVLIHDFTPKLIPILELEIRPISREEKRFLMERGKLYRTLAIGAHHKSYLGPIQIGGGYDHRTGTRTSPRTVRGDGRIMVDIKRYYIQQQGSVPNLASNPIASHRLYEEEIFMERRPGLGGTSAFNDRSKGEKRRGQSQEDQHSGLDDFDLWMTPPSIQAFSFRQRKFGICHIELMSDIVWRETAWEQLVLPKVKKDLIRALVLRTRSQSEVDRLEEIRWQKTKLMNNTTPAAHYGTSSSTSMRGDGPKDTQKEPLHELDIVDGKGGGCTILLHGKSGTGKTLTAEAVSEILRRPLYAVTVGELGTTPAALEQELTTILDLASCWNATILLDEADVFLAQRGDDIQRNGLVSIFLRTIEYFNGILILTSNLADKIDEAFSSRIHVSLRYKELGAAERSKVWQNFLGDLPGEFDFARLGEKHVMNGRQIRSAVRVAQALARDTQEELSQNLMEEVVLQMND